MSVQVDEVEIIFILNKCGVSLSLSPSPFRLHLSDEIFRAGIWLTLNMYLDDPNNIYDSVAVPNLDHHRSDVYLNWTAFTHSLLLY